MKKLPEHFLDTLQDAPGFDRSAFASAHDREAVTSVRLHPVKGARLCSDEVPVAWCANGRYLNKRPVFTLDPLFHAGAFYVQEASSMFLDHVVRSLVPDPQGLRVLDLCAAPGGKSTLLASWLEETSLLVSNEVIRSRASILEENAVRWGYSNHWVTGNDPRDFSRLPGYFDLMVVDAPCSGSGLFRKDDHALEEWSEANVQMCSLRQQRILADAWPALKENGWLVYATCSYSVAEDEAILEWMSANFSVETVEVPLNDDWGVFTSHTHSGLTGYRFYPDRVQGEGLFMAVVQKRASASVQRLPRQQIQREPRVDSSWRALLANPDRFFVRSHKDLYAAILQQHAADYELLSKSLYLRKAGVALGSPAAKEWLPAHDVALSIDRAQDIGQLELNKEQALKYLKKEDVDMAAEKGWKLVSYQGRSLGWIKSLGNRSNNYLPKSWRIRMDVSGYED